MYFRELARVYVVERERVVCVLLRQPLVRMEIICGCGYFRESACARACSYACVCACACAYAFRVRQRLRVRGHVRRVTSAGTVLQPSVCV